MKTKTPKIAIVGGGIAGSTAAMYLAQQGLQVTLIEQGSSLVNGPPICHLHAGGNLYREIDTQQCIALLTQSIDTLKLYPQCADYRPTLIAIPQRDPGCFKQLEPRLKLLQQHYQQLVDNDPSNQVLGEPNQYYQCYTREEVEKLAQYPIPERPRTLDDWLIPAVKTLDLDKLKFPLILVQEYGLNVFRLASCATLTTQAQPHCEVLTQTTVTQIERQATQWSLTLENNNQSSQLEVDYLINATGYQTGTIDDLVGFHCQRFVEFKAAYVTHWEHVRGYWPEVIFYGQRGTPHGMAQLTPYPNGYFQIHGMTQDITLFKDGLVNNEKSSAQPLLPKVLADKTAHQWPQSTIALRTQRAINFIAHFIPSYEAAQMGGKPLYGAQQIPGGDPDLRATDVDFSLPFYARSEIVKASSAIDAARLILDNIWQSFPMLPRHPIPYEQLNQQLLERDITATAQALAIERHYPAALAHRVIAR